MPKWLQEILTVLWEILKNLLTQVGEPLVQKLTTKIIEVSTMSVNNDKKFQLVYDYAKSLLPGMKDSAINLLIESIYNKLKVQKVVS